MATLTNSPFLSSTTVSVLPTMGQLDQIAEKKPQRRCGHSECKKKLLLTDLDCRCGARFCASHRMPEDHACSYNHKAHGTALLNTQLVRAVADKLERI